MKRQRTSKRPTSRRERQRAEMLKTALSRPGVREVMAVYGNWQEKDRGLDTYRSAAKKPARITTTNSSNIC